MAKFLRSVILTLSLAVVFCGAVYSADQKQETIEPTKISSGTIAVSEANPPVKEKNIPKEWPAQCQACPDLTDPDIRDIEQFYNDQQDEIDFPAEEDEVHEQQK